MISPLLQMREITKSFPGVKALDGVTFDLKQGEVHALAGVYPYGEFGGEILIAETPQRFHSVRDSEAAGIAVIYQELSLVKDLSVAENIFLGRAPRRLGIINWEELFSRAQKLLDELHLQIDPRTPIRNLGI